jgi:hypothetical protein
MIMRRRYTLLIEYSGSAPYVLQSEGELAYSQLVCETVGLFLYDPSFYKRLTGVSIRWYNHEFSIRDKNTGDWDNNSNNYYLTEVAVRAVDVRKKTKNRGE